VSPKQNVVKKTDTEEFVSEYRLLVEKLKFLGVEKKLLEEIIDEEYDERTDS